MLTDELSSDMDRITQEADNKLQDAILDLLSITATSIEYITKRAQFEQTSTEITQSLQTADGAPREEYRETIEGFVQDIITRSKDCEKLIAALPSKGDSTARVKRLEELKVEMDNANEEYREALSQAEALLKELQEALGTALGQDSRTDLSTAINSLSTA